MKQIIKLKLFSINNIFSHFIPLYLKKRNTFLKWNQKLFKWPLALIVFIILLLCAVYILYIFTNDDIQSECSDSLEVSDMK
ncbi:Uncharacterized protein FWK35_00024063 [Aphis craccivora]|uniref:Uncharacterized protein n=1 Tax=Aphis craccivora TaxID=307492 RepID=A0A6G0Y7H3_APHCR|nr:Uncharacterized protein FWK35_00024063 [Aphis craccivora]